MIDPNATIVYMPSVQFVPIFVSVDDNLGIFPQARLLPENVWGQSPFGVWMNSFDRHRKITLTMLLNMVFGTPIAARDSWSSK